MEVVIEMFGGEFIAFKFPLTNNTDGCDISLKAIPLNKHLSSNQMDQLIFYKGQDKPEIYFRIFFNLYANNLETPTITFMKSITRATISTVGITSVSTPTYVEMT